MDTFPGYLPPAPMTINPRLAPATLHRADFLAFLAGRMGWTFGAEIGVSFGETLARLLAARPDLDMLGVDTWAPNPPAPEPAGWTAGHHLRAEAAARAALAPFGTRATLVKARSTEAAAGVPAGFLDFVWLDGDHGTEALAADIAAWLPALKPAGWLLGHDINWPTVRRAVGGLLPGYLVGPDSVWFRPVHPAPSWWAARFA